MGGGAGGLQGAYTKIFIRVCICAMLVQSVVVLVYLQCVDALLPLFGVKERIQVLLVS